MKSIEIYPGVVAPKIVAGCMRIAKFTEKEIDVFINTALDCGINFFDHADIYRGGECEEVFGRYLAKNPKMREKIHIQTKCGIVKGSYFGAYYDFSKEHLIESVEGSLKRLGIDTIDTLLLHRPDALVEPEEVAEAFDSLQKEGKVKNFGVSNHTPYQIELLQKYVRQPLKINQLQFSVVFTGMVDSGMNTNMKNDAAIGRDFGVLDYCRINDITIQAWSPYQKGFFGGTFIGDPEYPKLNEVLGRLAEKYSVTPTAIASAFILRHPAKWQVVTGTTKPERLREIAAAAEVKLDKYEWYEIYMSAGNKLP